MLTKVPESQQPGRLALTQREAQRKVWSSARRDQHSFKATVHCSELEERVSQKEAILWCYNPTKWPKCSLGALVCNWFCWVCSEMVLVTSSRFHGLSVFLLKATQKLEEPRWGCLSAHPLMMSVTSSFSESLFKLTTFTWMPPKYLWTEMYNLTKPFGLKADSFKTVTLLLICICPSSQTAKQAGPCQRIIDPRPRQDHCYNTIQQHLSHVWMILMLLLVHL